LNADIYSGGKDRKERNLFGITTVIVREYRESELGQRRDSWKEEGETTGDGK